MSSNGVLYEIIFRRLEFDSARGMAENNRLSSYLFLYDWLSNSSLVDVLLGVETKLKFDGELTSIASKIYYRGVFSDCLCFLFIGLISFSNYSSRQNKRIYFLFLYCVSLNCLGMLVLWCSCISWQLNLLIIAWS